MKPLAKKRIYLIALLFLLATCISIFCIYRKNRSVHGKLTQMVGLVDVNPRKTLLDVEQIDRRFLTEKNYMLCDLLKAEALAGIREYVSSDSLLDFVLPYFKYKEDSLRIAEIYYYKGEIARNSNFLFEAIEYFTLCTQYNSGANDLPEMTFYLNNFKGRTYHIKRMNKEEKEAKLTALELAKELKNKQLIEKAYSELALHYTRAEDRDVSLLKEAVVQGYSGSLQARLLFQLSEKYADDHQLDTALIYAREIPHLYQDSVDYLLGKIYFNLNRPDSARFYLNRSCRSNNPMLCYKAYCQLLDLNVHKGSMNGVADCLEKLAYYEKLVDSIENKETFAKIEDVEKLRKTIHSAEAAEMEYYKYWILYFWIMMAAFALILILLIVTVILQKKKKDLQLKRQQARLDALKMQIDPHFIFNNLSILLDLVETGDKAAPDYVKSLSKVYRYIVSNVDNNLALVEDELVSLENYVFLLKIRFGNAIHVDIRVEDAIKERQIPPIVLQMLLENAIKHNGASEEEPLFIRIYSERDKLVVENNRKPVSFSASSHRIGLRNIKERYLLIGAPAPEIFENENIYRITLSTL